MQTGATIVESWMELPQKIKNRTVLWPSNSTSGNIFEETQNSDLKEYIYPRANCRVIYNNQDLEADTI